MKKNLCPWGKINTLIYTNPTKTRAMVWAENGKGFLILEKNDLKGNEVDLCFYKNGFYWVPGVSMK